MYAGSDHALPLGRLGNDFCNYHECLACAFHGTPAAGLRLLQQDYAPQTLRGFCVHAHEGPPPPWCIGVPYPGGLESRTMLAHGALVLMAENQGVCDWVALLDGSADPPVLISVDGAPWRMHARSFSAFVYSRVWDRLPAVWALTGPTAGLPADVLSRLRLEFIEGPETAGWPRGCTQHRFVRDEQRVTTCECDGKESLWSFYTPDEGSLRELAHLLRCEGIELTVRPWS